MVMNISAFKTGNYDAVIADIKQVVEAAKPYPVKVIIETCLLTDTEKHKAAQLVAQAGASFVKTSTGFSSGGATVEDVKILRQEAYKGGIGVKAAGGIRDAAMDDYHNYIYDRRRGGFKSLIYLQDKGLCTGVDDFFKHIFTSDNELCFPQFGTIGETIDIIHNAGGKAFLAHSASDFHGITIVITFYNLGINRNFP